jgi:hypothetical protein
MKSLLGKLGVVVIIGIVTFGCAEMRGGQWKSFSSTDLYEGFYYVSNSHLLYKSTVQQVSVKLEYTKKGIAEYVKEFGKDYENLSYSLQFLEIECRTKTQRILSIDEYSAEGNILKIKPRKRSLSKSLAESLSKAVCK